VNEITQAFVFAAGLGMRLRPLTDELPKPLIPIFQKPLVTFALDHLIGVGVNRFVINTHRHPELFQNFFAERDLYSYSDESWLVRRAFYESALEQIAALHALPESVCSEMKQHLSDEFNSELYLWEQNYFFENCLGRLFKIEKEKLAQLASLPALQEIADHLASFPRVLVHRDFQSQNIIIRNGQAHLIDFQGMRPGLAEYDLASLLHDPYVDLPKSERAELTAYYCGRQLENGIAINGDFDLKLRLCAMHRLMQALGAYGFLGLVKGHKHFLKHVAAAMQSLQRTVAEIDGLTELEKTLRQLT
jgi:aminoglycoside/choline kinase family phosphotransferase